ncbi:MAG TPA: threonine--tRNA ligase [Nanoarchaeota archaeon]|nr:threonine--tRNA ligase [Nanoarchaeota archaeon]
MAEHKQLFTIETLRHSTAHVLAQAVKELFPETKLGIGPNVENGFYYDFDRETPFTPEDLKKLEDRMKRHIKAAEKFEKIEYSEKEARELLKNEPYKIELLNDLIREGEKPTFYKHGEFIDLCRGPHINSTADIRAYKLMKVAAAYWKGDQNNKQMQRIYGTAFMSKEELEAYIKKIEEAEKRDHTVLGHQMEIYSTHQEVGAGLVHWHPNGAIIRMEIENFWKAEHIRRGYKYVYTPHIGNLGLWKTSGHWDFYRESMYSPMKIDSIDYLVKPMNCPFHLHIYKTRLHSYRELPVRYAELGTVYRYEKSGVLHGMTRVRGFTQDDAHILCTPEQLKDEIVGVLELALFMLRAFGYKEYVLELSVRDPANKAKYLGEDAVWDKAEGALKDALNAKNLKYRVGEGEAKFYGPSIDIKTLDALGREWQGPTIQVDFNLPEKFDVTYEGQDGKKHRPVMVHRTVLGSMERFVGCLIEHYAGRFPLWLAPVQVKILTIADRCNKFAEELCAELLDKGVRAETDLRTETLPKKVREAQLEQVPKIIIIGDKEVEAKTLAVRALDGKTSYGVKQQEFIDEVLKEIKEKKL